MKNKKEKDFWIKKTETFTDSREAKARASELRTNENTTDVILNKEEGGYIISYSVAKWYIEALDKAGVRL